MSTIEPLQLVILFSILAKATFTDTSTWYHLFKFSYIKKDVMVKTYLVFSVVKGPQRLFFFFPVISQPYRPLPAVLEQSFIGIFYELSKLFLKTFLVCLWFGI